MTTDTIPFAFTGLSDDVVELEVGGATHQYDAYDGARLVLIGPGGREELLVDCQLLDAGVWALAPTMLSELHELPAWEISLERGHAFSPTLVVHAPEGTEVRAA